METTNRELQYQTDIINTATPEQLTLMLYRAALQSVEASRCAMSSDPRSGLRESQLARDILSALADDANVQSPHGETMRELYWYCWRTLLSAVTSKSPEQCESVEVVLKNLIEGLEFYSGRKGPKTIEEEAPLSINFSG